MKRFLIWGCALAALLAIDVVIFLLWRSRNVEARYDRIILSAAQRYTVDPALVKAVVWQESRFHADAKGAAGELGLMQIRSLAAGEWAEAEDLDGFDHAMVSDPGTNTLAGTWYLSKLLRRYRDTDDPLPYALADYNAGRRNVLRWMDRAGKTNAAVMLRQMDFPGTRDYVKAVRNRFEHYRQDPPKAWRSYYDNTPEP